MCVFSSAILHQHKSVYTVQSCQEKEIKATLRANEEVKRYLLQTHRCLPRESLRKPQTLLSQIRSPAVLQGTVFPISCVHFTLVQKFPKAFLTTVRMLWERLVNRKRQQLSLNSLFSLEGFLLRRFSWTNCSSWWTVRWSSQMSQKPRLLIGVTCNQEEFCYPADSPDMERGGWPHRERKLGPVRES